MKRFESPCSRDGPFRGRRDRRVQAAPRMETRPFGELAAGAPSGQAGLIGASRAPRLFWPDASRPRWRARRPRQVPFRRRAAPALARCLGLSPGAPPLRLAPARDCAAPFLTDTTRALPRAAGAFISSCGMRPARLAMALPVALPKLLRTWSRWAIVASSLTRAGQVLAACARGLRDTRAAAIAAAPPGFARPLRSHGRDRHAPREARLCRRATEAVALTTTAVLRAQARYLSDPFLPSRFPA